MDPRQRGTLEMTLAMAISGSIGWFVVMSGQPVISVVFWRCAIGAATLLLIGAALGKLRPLPDMRTVALASAGGVAIVANWLFLFAAYPRASISIATIVYNMQPFMLVLMGALLLGERLEPSKMLWLAVAFAGTLLIALAGSIGAAAGTDYLRGVLSALAAALCYAVSALLTKRLTGTPPHLIALIHLCVGMIMLVPWVAASPAPRSGWPWTFLATIGVVHTGLMYILLYGAIQKLPTYLIGSLSFIYPLVAILVDMLAFGHRLAGLQICGGVMILVAAAAATLGWSPLRRRRAIA